MQVDVETVKNADSLQVAMTAAMTDALLLESQLKTSGVVGQVTFTLPDQSAVQSTLLLELGHIGGPWDGGPIEVTVQDGFATLTNKVHAPVNVTDLMVYGASGSGTPVPVDATLGQDEAAPQPVQLPDGGGDLYPVYTVQPGPVDKLQEIRSFVEDVHTNVIFLNLINYAAHSLKQLSITARLKDVDGTYPVAIGDALSGSPQAQVDMLLPLSNYIGQRVLQYQVLKTRSDDSVTTTDWIDWNLESKGNVVSLQWTDIAQDMTGG
jgi:hypothetical protein